MNEEEWLTTTEAEDMYALTGKPSRRKHRLFGCECVRLIWAFNGDDPPPVDLSTAEAFADKAATRSALQTMRRAVQRTLREIEHAEMRTRPVWGAYRLTVVIYSDKASENVLSELNRLSDILILEATEWAPICNVIRDIFGNPFRLVAFDPVWRTEAAVGIAAGIYEDRAFERMPILADALQDAGCEYPDILTHCREPGVHVRGCWVVDLVLGKE